MICPGAESWGRAVRAHIATASGVCVSLSRAIAPHTTVDVVLLYSLGGSVL